MPYTLKEMKDAGLHMPKPSSSVELGDLTGGNRIKLPDHLKAKLASVSVAPEDASKQDFAIIAEMTKHIKSDKNLFATFSASPRGQDAESRKNGHFYDYVSRTIAAVRTAKGKKENGFEVMVDDKKGDGSDWRAEFRSRNELSSAKPEYLVDLLVPASSFTIITAPSYNAKTWFAMQIARSISTGRTLCGHFAACHETPVRYHVPEMNEAFVRERMNVLGIRDSDTFLVRAMETGAPWALDDARMLASSRGAVVFLDTTGYFNEADDTSNYQQSVRFGRAIFNLITVGHARAVVGLYHPPKTSAGAFKMTLENMVLGSAGYGGLLRSCLGLRNLNPDPNDPNVLLYVEGLKNPSLRPFLLHGIPLRMKALPGRCPNLSSLMADKKLKADDPRKRKAFEMFEKKIGRDEICTQLNASSKTVTKWKKEWDELEIGEVGENELVIYD